ncbi:nucleoside hydrolase [Hymenobacter crusticola]|uniref:Nucleoside hydrolase n=1 Tax=Hymenobacter crusticola TaxID=1770526 RepID=A0A243WDE4_9BACT|nr:nucleoside hydrolase [Hymenobacter crusticola]OUJ72838.1 nucleoside hydrolase [Hymenobacter crusticola]
MLPSSSPAKRPVLFDHDGGVDDFLSLLLLLHMQHVELLGVSVTPADCYLENALLTTHKLLALAQRSDVEVSGGNYHGVNAFSSDWRAKPKILNALPSMINVEVEANAAHYDDNTAFIIRQLEAARAPVTFLITGPCSSLVHTLGKAPSLREKIAEVVWMGGAVDVIGNVKTYNHDGSAEWNVFWDPISAHKLFRSGLPITLVPLDVTNTVPVSFDFLKKLASQADYFFSNLAGQFWATTIDTIPAYEYTYFMWDVLTTSYLAIPNAFQLEMIELEVAPSGPAAGNTYRKPGSGQWVKTAVGVRKEEFYEFLFDLLKQNIVAAP